MIKQADIGQLLDGLKDKATDAGGQLMNWYGGLNPEMRATITRGLAGAAVGGAAGYGLTPKDEKGRRPMNQALLGMLLGGGTAAALPAGLKMLGNGGIKFKSESDRPLGLRALEAPGDFVFGHPLTVGLPVATAWRNNDAFGLLAHGVREHGGTGKQPGLVNKAKALATNTRDTLRDAKFWRQSRFSDFSPMTQAMKNRGVPPLRGGARGRMAMVPLALLLGLAADKYVKGQW